MDTVTYPDSRVAQFVVYHFLPVKLSVKENPRLLEEYLVSWTPNILILDEKNRVRYRIEGYLPPEDLVAYLSMGIGKYWLNDKQFAKAGERFEEVSQRHARSDIAAEALYWIGVVRYKHTHDPAQLRPAWQKLAQEYPHSEWAKRTNIPSKT
jgi:Thioredoxin-like domain